MFHVPNKFRLRGITKLCSDDSYGNNGFFIIPFPNKNGLEYRVMASDGAVKEGDPKWEHASVSVALPNRDALRCPTWDEMCYIKNLFWDEEDTVIQYHPAKSEYVNRHPYVLHLWSPVDDPLPIPNKLMVG